MAIAAVGLRTHIWNNNLKSVVLLALYPLILAGIVWAVFWAFGMSLARHSGENLVRSYSALGDPKGFPIPVADAPFQPDQSVLFANAMIMEYWPMILSAVAVWFMVAWFFHTSMIRRLSRSRPVTRQEEPELYNLLENLCITQGVRMPQLEIIETHARNAFASGVSEDSYAITVTRGLMNSLTRDELEGVLAHELTHIINRDVRLLIVTVIFTGMFGFLAQLVWSSFRYRIFYFHGRRDKNSGGLILAVLMVGVILWLGYVATLFMRFALSRRREYMADAGAVEMTRNPEAMMRALMRISGRDHIPETTADIAMMCIENHVPFLGLFATHPPIEQRIQAISEMTGTPVPQLSHTGPAARGETFRDRYGSGQRPNPWLIRGRRD